VLFEESAFRVVAADVVHKGRSDHAPVWADLIRTR
jgi:endonuclease/exonuclease/phosphatase family metal-dependent hydrolase